MGARVEVRAGEMTRSKTLWGGGSFGENSFTLHFGLGDNESIDEITIYWPNQAETVTRIEGPITVDRQVSISQATGEITEMWAP